MHFFIFCISSQEISKNALFCFLLFFTGDFKKCTFLLLHFFTRDSQKCTFCFLHFFTRNFKKCTFLHFAFLHSKFQKMHFFIFCISSQEISKNALFLYFAFLHSKFQKNALFCFCISSLEIPKNALFYISSLGIPKNALFCFCISSLGISKNAHFYISSQEISKNALFCILHFFTRDFKKCTFLLLHFFTRNSKKCTFLLFFTRNFKKCTFLECEAIRFIQDFYLFNHSTLHLRHTPHDSYHSLLVAELERRIRQNISRLAHKIDIALRIIPIATWRPSCNNLPDGIGVVTSDIVADEHEGGTIAILARGELYESSVVLSSRHALPLIAAMSDVERIVVSDASGHALGILFMGSSILISYCITRICCHHIFFYSSFALGK